MRRQALCLRTTKLGRPFHQNGETRAVRRARTSLEKALWGIELGRKASLSCDGERCGYVSLCRRRLTFARTVLVQTATDCRNRRHRTHVQRKTRQNVPHPEFSGRVRLGRQAVRPNESAVRLGLFPSVYIGSPPICEHQEKLPSRSQGVTSTHKAAGPVIRSGFRIAGVWLILRSEQNVPDPLPRLLLVRFGRGETGEQSGAGH